MVHFYLIFDAAADELQDGILNIIHHMVKI